MTAVEPSVKPKWLPGYTGPGAWWLAKAAAERLAVELECPMAVVPVVGGVFAMPAAWALGPFSDDIAHIVEAPWPAR